MDKDMKVHVSKPKWNFSIVPFKDYGKWHWLFWKSVDVTITD